MRRVVTQLKRGKGLNELMTSDGMLDPVDHPGLLVLSGITTGPVPNFHCFMPWKAVWPLLFDLRAAPTIPASLEDAIFDSSLRRPGGSSGSSRLKVRLG